MIEYFLVFKTDTQRHQMLNIPSFNTVESLLVGIFTKLLLYTCIHVTSF